MTPGVILACAFAAVGLPIAVAVFSLLCRR